jgi:hypothetical protein
MNLSSFRRAAVPAAGAVLCGLLASCTSGSGSPAAGPTGVASATPVATASPTASASVSPTMKTAPPSQLCTVLDLAAARKVLADLRLAPQVDPNTGKAPEACSYASGDGLTMLTLTPATRSYDVELSLAHGLVRAPGAAGMRNVQVKETAGLGQAAFSEAGYLVQQRQNITYVVWRSRSRTWVLTLAEAGEPKNAGRVVPLARQISPRLPH